MIELEELTPKQAELMEFIGQYWQQNRSMPTLREMAIEMRYSSLSPIQNLIKLLVKKGYISKSNKARSIKIRHTIGNIPVVGMCNYGEKAS
jgi:SOS-response transcriptional repressor LexA